MNEFGARDRIGNPSGSTPGPMAIVFCAILVSLVSSIWSVRGDYTYDAVQIARDDPRLLDPLDLPAFFATEYWNEPGRDSALYRPLTIWSFSMGRAIHGPDAWGVHLINVLLHALLSAGVALLLIDIVRSPRGAMVGAALFAAHPVHIEVIAGGVGRADLAAAIACIAGYFVHRSIRLREARPHSSGIDVRRHLLLAGIFLAALCFKESAVVLPALLLLDDLRRRGWTFRQIATPAFLTLPLALYLFVRSQVIGSAQLPEIAPILQGAGAWDRVLFASEQFMAGLRRLGAPFGLVADYADHRRPAVGASDRWQAWAAAGGVVALWAGAIWLWVKHLRSAPEGRSFDVGVFALAVSFLLIAYAPVSNWFFPIGTPGADRLWLIPSIGAALAVAALPWERVGRGALVGIMSAVILLFTWLSWQRTTDWRSDEALWKRVHAVNSGNVVGWMFFGDRLRRQGLDTEAESAYRHAIELAAVANQFPPAAAVNLAELLRLRGERTEASALYARLIESGVRAYEVLINAGALAFELDDPDEALRMFARATEANPDRVEAWVNLALVLLSEDRPEEADARLRSALSAIPNDPRLLSTRVDVLLALGREEEAERLRQFIASFGTSE